MFGRPKFLLFLVKISSNCSLNFWEVIRDKVPCQTGPGSEMVASNGTYERTWNWIEACSTQILS